MEASKIGYRKWAIAFYQILTNLKGVSSMKLHRDLGISQPSAWFLAHRIREAMDSGDPMFSGPVEADETYKGRTEGRALERADWVAWQERLDAWETRRTQALEEGREFTEERSAPPA